MVGREQKIPDTEYEREVSNRQTPTISEHVRVTLRVFFSLSFEKSFKHYISKANLLI